MAAFPYHSVESVLNNIQIPPIKLLHHGRPAPHTTNNTNTTTFPHEMIYSSPEEESFQQHMDMHIPTTLINNNNIPAAAAARSGCFKVSTTDPPPNSSSSSSIIIVKRSTDNKLQSEEDEERRRQVTNNKSRKKSKEGLISLSAEDSPPSQEMGKKLMKGKRKKIRSNGSVVVMKKVQEKKEGCEEEGAQRPTEYIHVRARRGQATDNHSLAERVRREKISERMKILQALVPGCEKVTGKALMLDEIINYVQSLQSQVEFLSMKLASLNPMLYDFGMDLDSFMARPEQTLNSLNVQQPMDMVCDSMLANANNCGQLMDQYASSAFHLLQQSQLNTIPRQHLSHQAKGGHYVLWDMGEEERHIFGKQLQAGGFTNNNFSDPSSLQ